MSKKVLIFGITGQDGSYLADHYLIKQSNFIVHGYVRRIQNNPNISHLEKYIANKYIKYYGRRLILHHGDITDPLSVQKAIYNSNPDYIYNFAGKTNVKDSFQLPSLTIAVNQLGFLYILEAVRFLHMQKKVLIFQASTSQMFGQKTQGELLSQESKMMAESPYALSKKAAYQLIKIYRKAYNMTITTAISFNHQSPRRGVQFVTRKISKYVAAEHLQPNQSPLELGNINSIRDWGHAKDYVVAFKKIIELNTNEDFVVATGTAYTVRELVQYAFRLINIQIKWKGQGISQEGICSQTSKVLVKINPDLFRPNQVPYLKGNSQKLFKQTGWRPQISFQNLIKEMVQSDIQVLSKKLEDRKSSNGD